MLAKRPEWSDRAIAKHVGVGHPLVSSVRGSHLEEIPDAAATTRTVERNGKTYAQDVSGQQMAAQERKAAKAHRELSRQVAHGEVSLPKAIEQLTGKPASKLKAAPAADAPAEALADCGPSAEELAADEQAHAADLAAMALVLGSDQPLADAVARVRQLTEQVRILQERIHGLTNEAAAAVRLAKHWRTKFEKLEKAAA
jgi:hypothetical protein